MKKYISTTLPYANAAAHGGHAFEFIIADIIAGYFRMKLGKENVFFNVGLDCHGQKVEQQAEMAGIDVREYCDRMAINWQAFCYALGLDFDNFYRTDSHKHYVHVKKFYADIKQFTETKEYTGNYCVGCEAFITDKAAAEYDGVICPIHKKVLVPHTETNVFFDLARFAPQIKDVLVDKTISVELQNLLAEPFELSITRQKVKWGIPTGEGNSVFYVWFEALLNYLFAIGYYEDPERFKEFWANSLIICGKDNLKFQAFILQALLLAHDIPQTKEVLVHGMILDQRGWKMSKSMRNTVDPVEQIRRYGSDAVRYYLAFGLNTFGDSKYSEEDLKKIWNSDIVGGLGNLIARLLHIIEMRDFELKKEYVLEYRWNVIKETQDRLDNAFERYDFKDVRDTLNNTVGSLHKRIFDEKPYAKECVNYHHILTEIYYELAGIIPYYQFILKKHSYGLGNAFETKGKKILFKKLV